MEDADEKMAAAEALIRLSGHSSPCRPPPKMCDLWPLNRPQTATSLKTIPSLLLPLWGLRSRRSRCSCIPEKATVEDESSAPASKTRRSPATPLDFGSTLAPSTSGSDEAPSSSAIPKNKRRRTGDPSSPFGDVYQKVDTAELAPVVGVAIPSSKTVRRRGKKKTVTELQEQERSLAEENEMLRLSVERKRKEMEDLIAENHKLRGEEVGTAELAPVVGVAIPSSKTVRRRGKKKTVTELLAQERSLAEENEMLRQSVETKRKEMEDLIAENHKLRGEEERPQRSKAIKPRFFLPDLNEAADI